MGKLPIPALAFPLADVLLVGVPLAYIIGFGDWERPGRPSATATGRGMGSQAVKI